MACGESNLCLWNGKTRVNVAIIMMIFQCFFMSIGLGSLSTVAFIFFKFLEFRQAGLDFVNWDIVWLMMSVGIIYTTIHFFIFFICLSVTDWRMFFKSQLCIQTITFFTVFFVIYFNIVIIVAGTMVKNYKQTIQDRSNAQLLQRRPEPALKKWVFRPFLITFNEDFITSFRDFMKNYSKEEKVKVLIDRIQFEYRCCGAENLKDWYATIWLKDSYITKNLKDQRAAKKQGYGGLALPFSCCSLKNINPCYISNVEKDTTNSTVHETANLVGCYKHFTEYLVFWMDLLSTIYYITLALELFNLILFRYLQTSMYVAILYADAEQTTPGYLLACGTQPMPPGFDLDMEKLAKDQEEMQELSKQDDTEILMAEMRLSRREIELINKGERIEMLEELKKKSEDEEEEEDGDDDGKKKKRSKELEDALAEYAKGNEKKRKRKKKK